MLIGLSGYARSGKDTLADHFVERHGFTKAAFADPMREALYRLDPDIELDGYLVRLAQAVDLMGWDYVKTHSQGFRPLMQRFGTEVGRSLWGQDFWVMQLLAKIDGNTIVSDVRFKNEADAIRDAGGVVWRINRPGVEATNDHASENDLDGYVFDFYLPNIGEPADLFEVADRILEAYVNV
jgi:hypothetical protein